MKSKPARTALQGRSGPDKKGMTEDLLARMVGLTAFLIMACLLIGALVVSTEMAQTSSTQTLRNADIIQMVHAKLSDGVIIAKIKSSQCKFDTTTEQLIKLKAEGVSDKVLKAMAECGAPPGTATTAAASPADPNNPESPHPPGIYLLKQSTAGRRMIALEPTSYSGEKMGGFMSSAMTMGLSKVKYRIAIRGSKASLRLTEARPTFYFYFNQSSGGFGNSGGFGGIPTSPADFVLARMEKKRNTRQLVVGQFGITGGSTGTLSKDTMPFSVQEMRLGVYKAQPNDNLKPGEYCFFFTRSGQTMGLTGGTLFAFGIDRAK